MSIAKIAVVTAATNTIPRFRIDMIDEFVRRGCEVVVMGDEPTEKWVDYFADHGVWYRQYKVSRTGLGVAADMQTILELGSLMRREYPTKVFTYQAKGNIYGTIAAHFAGVLDIYPMMGGLGSVFNARDIKSKIVGSIVQLQYRYAFKYAKRVFFQNQDDVARFVDMGIVEQSKVVMTHGSGVNLAQYPERLLPDNTSFLFVGRLVRGKGIMEFLEAARIVKQEYPEVRFDVVGSFDSNPTCISEGELRKYTENGIVVYHGQQEEMQSYYENCSAFVLPSYYGEGTPKSALEAMSTGRPLIMADAVGCREVVKEGYNGFLVPIKDSNAIALAMKEMIRNKRLCQSMAKASRSMAVKYFDVNKVNVIICETMGV